MNRERYERAAQLLEADLGDELMALDVEGGTCFGFNAVATGVWRAKGTENGKPFSETERFTDTYVKMAGEWKCVATHSSTMK